MTPDPIPAIRQRLADVTPSPWNYYYGPRFDCVESLAITSSVDGLMRVTLTLIGVSVEGWTPPQPVAAPQEEP